MRKYLTDYTNLGIERTEEYLNAWPYYDEDFLLDLNQDIIFSNKIKHHEQKVNLACVIGGLAVTAIGAYLLSKGIDTATHQFIKGIY